MGVLGGLLKKFGVTSLGDILSTKQTQTFQTFVRGVGFASHAATYRKFLVAPEQLSETFSKYYHPWWGRFAKMFGFGAWYESLMQPRALKRALGELGVEATAELEPFLRHSTWFGRGGFVGQMARYVGAPAQALTGWWAGLRLYGAGLNLYASTIGNQSQLAAAQYFYGPRW